MPGFGPASAPVASCGVLGFLEAPSSYNFDYIGVDPWREPYREINCGLYTCGCGPLQAHCVRLDRQIDAQTSISE